MLIKSQSLDHSSQQLFFKNNTVPRRYTRSLPHSKPHSRISITCQSSNNDSPEQQTTPASPRQQPPLTRSNDNRRAAESTDWIASSLTRRFGLAGGLAWLAFLTFGVVSEQIKTRLEVAAEEQNTKLVDSSERKEIITPEGIKYTDLKVGGGSRPQKGFLIVLEYTAYADGILFEDTKTRGKPIVFLYNSRPFSGGLCRGVEIALETMRAGGSRRVTIPAQYGFGEDGLTLRPTEHVPEKQGVVPPGATLEYELNLLRVSIPPS